MSGVIVTEAQIFIIAFFLGILLMAAYDGLRILRVLFKHKAWLVGLEDAVYWIASAILVFGMIYEVNDGSLRWYLIAGAFAGMTVYQLTVSSWLLRLVGKAVRTVKKKIGAILGKSRRNTKKTVEK